MRKNALRAVLIGTLVVFAGCLGSTTSATTSTPTQTPADVDGDGLTDKAEKNKYGTYPTVADTDGDGLGDGVEVRKYSSDPTKADTDGDGIDDGKEVRKYGTDPAASDGDGDGLNDSKEANQYGTNPGLLDTDGDGIHDGSEVNQYGTDPTLADTDGDGLNDSQELNNDALSGADPLQKDVFVELDYAEEYEPPLASISSVESAFDESDVSNPDGTTGINLHIVKDSSLDQSKIESENSLETLMQEQMDYEGEGYIYGAVVGDTEYNRDDVAGFSTGCGDNSQFALQNSYTNANERLKSDELAGLLIHELGHSLGIDSQDFDGVDSQQNTFDDYESSMNYNAPLDFVGFSSGGEFDDWAHISQNLETCVPAVA